MLLEFTLLSLGILSSGAWADDSVISSRATALTEALLDPAPAFDAYPDVRQARANGLGSIAEALGGGSSSGFFSSMLSGITGMVNKFSTSMGGPSMPSAMAKAFDGIGQAAQGAPPAIGAFKPPRMTRPGPEVFKAAEARRRKIKGIHRKKRQISVKTFKAFDGTSHNLLKPLTSSPFGGELFQILQAVSKMWSGMGGLGKTPVSRMKGHMDGFKDGAAMLAYKVSDLPNEMFGAMRSKRQAVSERAVLDNEIKTTLAELAVAHQKNWFTYLRSYNGSALECQELEFCRTAQASGGLQTAAARSGGKLLSYLVSGLRDARGKTGDRLSQAVDCCLSDDRVQAEGCQNFYLQQCLEADASYEPSRD